MAKRKLTLSAYSERALAVAFYPRIGKNLPYPTLGLCGEAGEAAEKVKKRERDGRGRFTKEQREAFLKELGDVLWYITACAMEVKSSLEEVAQLNLRKLEDRAARGRLGGSGDNR